MESQGGPLLRAGFQRHALLCFGLGRMSLSSVLMLTILGQAISLCASAES